MLSQLDGCGEPTCEDCDRRLGTTERRLVYETDAGQRRVYECACGAVTITVTQSTVGDERRT